MKKTNKTQRTEDRGRKADAHASRPRSGATQGSSSGSAAGEKDNRLPEPLVYDEPAMTALLLPKGAVIKVNGIPVRLQSKVWVEGATDMIELIGPASALVTEESGTPQATALQGG